jgi:hypothetical protein
MGNDSEQTMKHVIQLDSLPAAITIETRNGGLRQPAVVVPLYVRST